MSTRANDFYACVAKQCTELAAPLRMIYRITIKPGGPLSYKNVYRDSLVDIIGLLYQHELRHKISAISIADDGYSSEVVILELEERYYTAIYTRTYRFMEKTIPVVTTYVPNQIESDLMKHVIEEIENTPNIYYFSISQYISLQDQKKEYVDRILYPYSERLVYDRKTEKLLIEQIAMNESDAPISICMRLHDLSIEK